MAQLLLLLLLRVQELLLLLLLLQVVTGKGVLVVFLVIKNCTGTATHRPTGHLLLLEMLLLLLRLLLRRKLLLELLLSVSMVRARRLERLVPRAGRARESSVCVLLLLLLRKHVLPLELMLLREQQLLLLLVVQHSLVLLLQLVPAPHVVGGRCGSCSGGRVTPLLPLHRGRHSEVQRAGA